MTTYSYLCTRYPTITVQRQITPKVRLLLIAYSLHAYITKQKDGYELIWICIHSSSNTNSINTFLLTVTNLAPPDTASGLFNKALVFRLVEKANWWSKCHLTGVLHSKAGSLWWKMKICMSIDANSNCILSTYSC